MKNLIVKFVKWLKMVLFYLINIYLNFYKFTKVLIAKNNFNLFTIFVACFMYLEYRKRSALKNKNEKSLWQSGFIIFRLRCIHIYPAYELQL
jgi:hypothetical protein